MGVVYTWMMYTLVKELWMSKYKIVETFYSIQGEGHHAGKAAFFIRFFGCNLKCEFGNGFVCDDKAHSNKSLMQEYTSQELVAMVPEDCFHVVITGGEASLQDINHLITSLKDAWKTVQVETNGHNLENIKSADWITYSPKEGGAMLNGGFDELKLLAGVYKPVDIDRWDWVTRKYIQAIGGEHQLDEFNMAYCTDFVMKYPKWRLSTQLHKIWGLK